MMCFRLAPIEDAASYRGHGQSLQFIVACLSIPPEFHPVNNILNPVVYFSFLLTHGFSFFTTQFIFLLKHNMFIFLVSFSNRNISFYYEIDTRNFPCWYQQWHHLESVVSIYLSWVLLRFRAPALVLVAPTTHCVQLHLTPAKRCMAVTDRRQQRCCVWTEITCYGSVSGSGD